MKSLNKLSVQIIFFGIISFVFLLLFSYTTSPLHHVIGFDSAIFKIMGNSILHGKTIYVDIFDHKGPLLFYLEALGLFINYHYGIFILQCVFLTITTILWYKTAFLFLENKTKSVIAVLITLVAFCGVIKEGNKSEEWSLLFISLPMYWTFKYCLAKKSIPYIYTMCMGLCFGVLAFFRINNGAFICGIVLGYMIIYIIDKKYVELLKQGLFFIIGILLIIIPVCLYFYNLDAFSEMLDGTFLFNMGSYSARASYADMYKNELLAVFVYGFGGLVIIAVSKQIKQFYGNKILCLLYPIIALVLLLSAYQLPFHNYYILILPIVLLGTVFILKLKLNVHLLWIMLFPYIVAAFMWIYLSASNYNAITEYRKEISQMMSKIPPSDYNSVYNYNITFEGLACYIDNDIIPMNKYFIYGHRDLLHLNDKDDINKYSPKWITTMGENHSNIPEQYVAVDSVVMNGIKIANSQYALYVPKVPLYLYERIDSNEN